MSKHCRLVRRWYALGKLCSGQNGRKNDAIVWVYVFYPPGLLAVYIHVNYGSACGRSLKFGAHNKL